ncbi:D-alanine--D-alanine ligase [Methylohalobius crimeensis]|uniref:D-alanine--D-alanine ligase n=1 Tax=Methylohalobius crimeensis TaxID=244365 RepID=UPI0003B691D8|nr:D-alanine--D-alanine ligase [Methylohalobius crimeensis]
MTGLGDPGRFGKVAVAMGGASAEREISLISGEQVFAALQRLGVDAKAVDVGRRFLDELAGRGFDRVFNILHGRGGEDGVLQGLLEALDLPYTGSGVLGSALTMDKLTTKWCWRGAGLPTPDWQVLETREDLARCGDYLGFPVIVKPALEGSSLGMSKADDRHQLVEAWTLARRYDSPVFAERWIDGEEYTATLLQKEILPLIRLETPRIFYDFEAKYRADSTRYHCPCGLPAEMEQALMALVVRACGVLRVSGWGRVDLFLDRTGQPWLIEVNTVPGMTDHSLVPMAARAAGIEFDELVWRILETSVQA